MVPNDPKLSKIIQNGSIWSKMVKMYEMVKYGQNHQKLSKWSKIVQNDPKWSKMIQMVKNGGPDLERARRTGPSTRRIFMTLMTKMTTKMTKSEYDDDFNFQRCQYCGKSVPRERWSQKIWNPKLDMSS